MLIPSHYAQGSGRHTSLSRRVNANSQLDAANKLKDAKLIKKGEC